MNYKAFLSNFSEGLSNLRSTRQRSLLGLLGVVIGTASVIMLVNIAGIVKHQILDQFKSMGTTVFTISMESQKEDSPGFNMEKIDSIIQANPHIKKLVAFSSLSSEVHFEGQGEYDYYSAIACDSGLFDILNITPWQGRLLSDFDTYESYVFVGKKLNTKAHLSLGSVIRVGQSGFSIIGIGNSAGDNLLLPFFADETIFMSIKNAKSLVKKFKVTSMLGEANTDDVVEEGTKLLIKQFKKTHPETNFSVRTAKTIIDQAKKQAQLLTILLAAIGSIALIVGGIGVMNVMLVSVAQRKTEIGLRIAIGARDSDIKMLFLSEAITLCFFGGLIGTVIGLAVSAIFAMEMSMPFVITWLAIPTGIAISVLSGVLSGVYPAMQAAKMNPIEALRTD